MILDKNSFLGDQKNRRLIIGTLAVLLTGSIVYHFLEGWGWIDSIYFSVITLTTVGYGDLSPQTDLGKIFTIFYVITGIGILFTFINTFFQHRVDKIQTKQNKK
ncbi:MAG: two pore domain potassium channel family protein [Crocinitomix sp.]|nr:two pore domain potassium channel family protein [Crocinitomix sp.]